MTLPLPLLIGLRYVRARKSQFFVSFITWVSLLLICVAVAFLILILSVMNGFEGELRARLLSLSAHATLSGSEITSTSWRELAERAQKVAGVAGVAPYVELQGLIAHEPELSGVTVRGIDPRAEPSVSTLGGSMVDGQLTALVPGRSQIILGRVLAYQLSVGVGDNVTVMIPVGSAGGEGINPRIQTFTVA